MTPTEGRPDDGTTDTSSRCSSSSSGWGQRGLSDLSGLDQPVVFPRIASASPGSEREGEGEREEEEPKVWVLGGGGGGENGWRMGTRGRRGVCWQYASFNPFFHDNGKGEEWAGHHRRAFLMRAGETLIPETSKVGQEGQS